MVKTITREQVSQLIERLHSELDFEIEHKADSAFMKTIGGALDLMGIINHDDFMKRFTTTIGHTIYAPFKFGDSDSRLERWNHVGVLVHELAHVYQYDHSPVLFPGRYLGDRSWRAQYEAEAFSADLQLYFWRTGKIYDIEKRSLVLLHYGLEPSHCKYVENHLWSVAETIKAGGQVSSIATAAIDALEDGLHGETP